jgi:hypothetical protein
MAVATAVILLSAGAATLSPATLGASPQPSEKPAAFDTWTRSDLPDPAPGVWGGGEPRAVVAFDDGCIAVGSVIGDCCDGGQPSSDRGVAWMSRDGRHWQLHDPIPGLASSIVYDVVTDGTTLIALGATDARDPHDPGARVEAAWWSTDGTQWDRVTGEVPTMVAAGQHGFVGATETDTEDTDTVSYHFLQSTDGQTWTPTSEQFPAWLSGIASAEDGSAIAIGRVPQTNPDGSRGSTSAIWQTTDSASWTGATVLPSMAQAHVDRIVRAGSDGYLVTAESYPPDGSASAVGQVWAIHEGAPTLLSEIPINPTGGLKNLFVSGGTVIVTGDELPFHQKSLNAVVWVSTDGGLTFARVSDQPAFDGLENDIRALVEVPTGIVALGSYWERDTMHPPPAMWFAPRPELPMVVPGATRARVE